MRLTQTFQFIRAGIGDCPGHFLIYAERWLLLSAIQSTRIWMSPVAFPYNGFIRTATFTAEETPWMKRHTR